MLMATCIPNSFKSRRTTLYLKPRLSHFSTLLPISVYGLRLLKLITQLSIVVFCILQGVATVKASDNVEEVFQSILSPGPLQTFHQHLAGVTNCTACHSVAFGVDEQKCLQCHKQIQQRLQQKLGYHGTLSTKCQQCHQGHKPTIITFEQKSFNHQLSQFHLTGKHATIACAACHIKKDKRTQKDRFTYLRLPLDCVGCHKSPHVTAKMENCVSCHTTRGWKDLKNVNHDKTRFSLREKHKKLQCDACHMDKKFTGLQFDSCSSCHQQKTVHAYKIEPCNDCHNEKAWDLLNENWQQSFTQHNQARFQLKGAHAKVPCAKCHTGKEGSNDYTLPFSKCDDCHQDPHRGKMHKPCQTCHNEASFKDLESFDHRQTNFTLDANHHMLACNRCHFDKNYNSTPDKCETCHLDITKFRRGLWGENWRKLPRIISPKARIVACVDCHQGQLEGKITGAVCLNCHSKSYKQFFLQRSILANRSIASARTKLAKIVKCEQHAQRDLTSTEEQLLFLEKNFHHNYLLTDSSLKTIHNHLDTLIHETCEQ